MKVPLMPQTLIGVSAANRGRFHAPQQDQGWARCDAITLTHFWRFYEMAEVNKNFATPLTPCPKCFEAPA